MHARLIEINPDYEAEFASVVDKREDDAGARHSLDKRDDVLCGIFPLANIYAIRNAMTFLRKIRGHVQTQPGPGSCVRVSCYRNAGIWLCNDVSSPIYFEGGNVVSFSWRSSLNVCRRIRLQNPFPKILPGFYNIADGAQVILDRCLHKNRRIKRISGQNFHSDAWNVIVRKTEC